MFLLKGKIVRFQLLVFGEVPLKKKMKNENMLCLQVKPILFIPSPNDIKKTLLRSWSQKRRLLRLHWYFIMKDTLQGINISYPGKRKFIFKSAFLWDMLVPRRVASSTHKLPHHSPSFPSSPSSICTSMTKPLEASLTFMGTTALKADVIGNKIQVTQNRGHYIINPNNALLQGNPSKLPYICI